MRLALALACGVLFGAGLAVAQMTDPEKVLAFLDVAGDWDPSLAFVMGTALLVSSAGYALARRRARPWVANRFHIPPPGSVDLRLAGGAALFGVGWGLAGFCPGPALAALASGSEAVWTFGAAMAIGTFAARAVRGIRPPIPDETAARESA